MMAKLFKMNLTAAAMIIGVLFLLLWIFNWRDSSLHSQTQEILSRNLSDDAHSRKECGLLLSLTAPEGSHLEDFGASLLSRIESNQSIDIAKNLPGDIVIDKACSGFCQLDKNQLGAIKKQLQRQQWLMQRWESLIKLNGAECRHPVALREIPLRAFLKMARWQWVQFTGWINEGRPDKVFSRLLVLNRFLVSSLQREKLTLMQSLAYVRLLEKTRKTMEILTRKNHPLKKELQKVLGDFYQPISFAAIARRTEIGELQIFQNQIDDQSAPIVSRTHWTPNHKGSLSLYGVTPSSWSRFLGSFFLPQSTLNEFHRVFNGSAAHPCVHGNTKYCGTSSRNPLYYLRNPRGKMLIDQTLNPALLKRLRQLEKAVAKVPS